MKSTKICIKDHQILTFYLSLSRCLVVSSKKIISTKDERKKNKLSPFTFAFLLQSFSKDKHTKRKHHIKGKKNYKRLSKTCLISWKTEKL